jgi:hypothetical protein
MRGKSVVFEKIESIPVRQEDDLIKFEDKGETYELNLKWGAIIEKEVIQAIL